MRARQQQYMIRSTGIIHAPISVYVSTSSQTPSSSPFDKEHCICGIQATYEAATPRWQVSKVSILTASSHGLNRNNSMVGSNMTVSRLIKSRTTMNVCSGREERVKRVYATTERRVNHVKLSSEIIPKAHALSLRNSGDVSGMSK